MEYRKMMNTVLDYIDGHYQEKMTVEMLAGIAHFSAYHFHRIFHSMTGETINDHIRNIRLSRAAYKLLYSQRLYGGGDRADVRFFLPVRFLPVVYGVLRNESYPVQAR